MVKHQRAIPEFAPSCFEPAAQLNLLERPRLTMIIAQKKAATEAPLSSARNYQSPRVFPFLQLEPVPSSENTDRPDVF